MKGKSRRYFFWGGILCCLTFLGRSSIVSGTSPSGTAREEYVAFGVPFSPWYESWETSENGRVVSTEWRVNILSWTWPVVLAGVGSLVYWRRSRPQPESASEAP